jgi:putative CRISPR-associated protein (TIGR02619 family)
VHGSTHNEEVDAMAKRDVLICTVGTSLYGNIERQDASEKLREYKSKGNLIGLSKELLKRDPRDRLLGAEINSITSLIKEKKMEARAELHLMVSDTDDGREVGEVLKHYYENSRNPNGFERVIIRSIEGLRDDDVKRFKNQGLRNLVKEIAKVAKEKGTERLIINATGGYKAQISLTGLIGQALEIPVMYMFERFDEIIELPPQPLSFNFDLWLDNYEEFETLSAKDKEPVLYDKVKSLVDSERLKTLIDEETIDGSRYVSLNPVGELFHQSFALKFQKEKQNLLPPPLKDSEREEPKLSEHFYHHPPLSAEDFVKRVWREKKYIKTIRDSYVNPDLPKESKFEYDKKHKQAILLYSDGTRATKFILEIPNAGELAVKAAVADLKELLRK